MNADDLTNLSDVKAWLGRTDTNSDALLAALITRASRQIYSYLQRPRLLPHTVTEIRDGGAGDTMMLRQWPVLSIASIVIDDRAIPQSFDHGAGWTLEQWDGTPPGLPQSLLLRGYAFGSAWGHNAANVALTYCAGYRVTNEPQTVSGGTANISAPYGAWASDEGVTYANGTPLARVAGTPALGQYVLDATAGKYDFNAADEDAAVLISYGFVPSDLADACIELVSERYKYAQRIGEKTHSLGGNETVSFDNTRFTPFVASLLAPYRNVSSL